MAQTITGIGQAKILTSLDTYNHTALLTSPYVVSCSVSALIPNAFSITIKLNGSNKLVITPNHDQSTANARVILSCAVNDIISVVLSSSLPSDGFANDFKGILSITPGLIG